LGWASSIRIIDVELGEVDAGPCSGAPLADGFVCLKKVKSEALET
jgi:hypothetical protein